MESVQGGVTAPIGYAASGVFCGIKKRGKDLALIASNRPAAAAGMLTRNRLPAACVTWVGAVLRRGTARAIVANSGNANACTGRRGGGDCRRTAQWAAQALAVAAQEVLVASTGVIGQPLPMANVREGIRLARRQLSRTGSHRAAEAIMTTDTRPKEFALRWRSGGRVLTLGGIAKGSGMIAPDMATMLCFLTTDAPVGAVGLRRALRQAVPETFNAITVDGECSTNDMVLLLANGAAGGARILPGSRPYADFLKALREVCRTLAHEIVRDGEGVTRIFRVNVAGAASPREALRIARRVANSPLVKTMVAGRDPNWGRIAAAVGDSGERVEPRRIALRLGRVLVFRHGEPTRVPRARLLAEVDQPEVHISIDLGRGPGQAQILSGDLTENYAKINAKYTT